MKLLIKHYSFFLIIFCSVAWVSCQEQKAVPPVKKPEQQSMTVKDYIHDRIAYQLQHPHEGKTKNDFPDLYMFPYVEAFYVNREYKPVWVDTGRWTPRAEEFCAYLDTAAYDGLFRNDYHYQRIQKLKTSLTDSLNRKDGFLWMSAELLLTDAFLHVALDLQKGRLQPDSLSWRHDTSKHFNRLIQPLQQFIDSGHVNLRLQSIQPITYYYQSLRSGIPAFVDSMDTARYTYVDFPFTKGDSTDSVKTIRQLTKRLMEGKYVSWPSKKIPDSTEMADAIKAYQKKKHLTVDGKMGPEMARSINLTDPVRFKRLAITLDKLKQLPDTLPDNCIFVNLPSFKLQVWDHDTIFLTSKIVCGKPITPTPVLTSAISDMVVYPTWTVPESIIKKEMLPGLKRNPAYLAKKGLNLYNSKGERIDPYSINWAKYNKGIPYKIQQGSGDDNALGVIKFNFNNPFAVYLHDTNQRYLFGNKFRALSHGCVRVQEWQQLAFYIIRNDSLNLKTGDTLRINTDTLTNWLSAKVKRRIPVKSQLPLFIRYYTCASDDGHLVFYDDIYNEDKKLMETYFVNK